MSEHFLDAIVGARPNMMKMAPLLRVLENEGRFKVRLVHTGQHTDFAMSESFFSELGLRAPDFHLGTGGDSITSQTARIMTAYEEVFASFQTPRGVIVVGDVTSTLACALVAVRHGIQVAHVEAGLRSGDHNMPEEINRILTDRLSELLFVSDPDGLGHLALEGRPRESTWLVGNIMVDTLMHELQSAGEATALSELGLEAGGYAYLTLHRPSNVDDRDVLTKLVTLFDELARECPIVWTVHPRTRIRLKEFCISRSSFKRIVMTGPLGYRDNLRLMRDAKLVLTDSGGVQEETSVLGVPCLTLRWNTERPVTVELGTSELVGNDPERIRDAWNRVFAGKWKCGSPIPLWDGRTAERIVHHLRRAWDGSVHV